MSRWPEGTEWSRHTQESWGSRVGDRRLPYWLRVSAAAYGSHGTNGHARFKRGELALLLGTVNPQTGEIRRYPSVARAVADAVEYGWLEEGSFWGCLIVPGHAIKKGNWWDNRDCPTHRKRANSTRRRTPNLRVVS